jgi:P-type Cu+ transporter
MMDQPVQAAPPPATATPAHNRLSLAVEGMHCASCADRVQRALRALPGVATASVNPATERAEVAFDGPADPSRVISAVEAAGYRAAADAVELALEEMHSASCVGRIERALLAVPGVMEASVNLATERARVRLLRGAATPADLVGAIEIAQRTWRGRATRRRRRTPAPSGAGRSARN